MDSLDLERRTYDERRAALLGAARGKFVLIKGTDVLGFFESEGQGLEAAYRKLGPRASFFLHLVETVEEEQIVHLGIFSARP